MKSKSQTSESAIAESVDTESAIELHDDELTSVSAGAQAQLRRRLTQRGSSIRVTGKLANKSASSANVVTGDPTFDFPDDFAP